MLMVIIPFNLRSISLLAWISRPKLRSSEPWFVETLGFFQHLWGGHHWPQGFQMAVETPRCFNQRQGRTSRKLWKTTTAIATSLGREIFEPKRLGEMVLTAVAVHGKFWRGGSVTVEARCLFCREDHFGASRKRWINVLYIHTKGIQLHVIFMHVHD